MKILWLTPIGERSAIGRSSRYVVEILVKEGHDVTVVSSQTEATPNPQSFLARTYPSVKAFCEQDDAASFDLLVAHFGDHFPNHAGCLSFLGHPRLIGVFHDADMTNFGNGFFAFGKELLPDVPQDALTRGEITGSIAAHCAGVVAHSPFYADALDPCDGPLAIIPLAWDLDEAAKAIAATPPSSNSGERICITTIGHINRNKCADRVIKAIGSSETLKARCDYRLVGAIDEKERNYLSELAVEQGVSLAILGGVDDATLNAEIGRADIISCLREPVLEGASASAIECMMHGKAVLVSHAGFYLELPADCVIRIAAETRPEDILKGLEPIALDQTKREAVATRAKAFADEVFSPKAYARDLMALGQETRSLAAYGRLKHRLASQLTGLGLDHKAPSSEFVLKALEDMVPMTRRPPAAQTGR